MSHKVYKSHAEFLLSMTPEQRAIYDRGYRDTEIDNDVANDAMIACATAMMEHTLAERYKLLSLGFGDHHPLCKKLNDEASDWDVVAQVQRRLVVEPEVTS